MKKFNKSTLAAVVGSATLALATSAPVYAESSVDISGWINQGVTYADDGETSDISAEPDNGNTLGSRLTFSGMTDLANTGMQAGFEVILEPRDVLGYGTGVVEGTAGSFGRANGDTINVLGHSLYISGTWGKLTFGQQSMPTDNIAVLADPSVTIWSSISPVFRGNAIALQQGSGAGTIVDGFGALNAAGVVSFGDLMGCITAPLLTDGLGIGIDCNGIYREGVRYDLPQFVDGLNIAVGMADDEVYDVAAKYNTQFAGRINTILHVGYAHNGSIGGDIAGAFAATFYNTADNFQAQLGLMDTVTGLFGTFAYQYEEADLNTGVTSAMFQDNTDAYWTKLGIKKKWNSLGDTAIAFQYGSYNDQYGPLAAAGVTGSEIQRIGVEVNQYFGSNLILYATYENLEANADGVSAIAQAIDDSQDLDLLTVGLTYFF